MWKCVTTPFQAACRAVQPAWRQRVRRKPPPAAGLRLPGLECGRRAAPLHCRLPALVGATLLIANAVAAEQPEIPPSCAQIVAVLDQSGGALSADEVAKKTHTDVETVRNCTDLWRRTGKDASAPKGVRATDQPIPIGCAQIVAVLDQGGSALSPDEVAKKTHTDVETVRNCTDLWRRTMEGGAHP